MVVELKKSVSSFESSPEFDSYESVRLDVDDDTSYFYPPNEVVGRTLVVFCPWGTQAMAQDIYNNVVGYRYQPYRADGAVLDPAAQIGDPVLVNDVVSFVSTNDVEFSSVSSSNISAPTGGEIDHEYEFKNPENRDIKRKIAENTVDIADAVTRLGRVEADYVTTDYLEANYAAVSQLNAVEARVSTLEANQITVNYLQANYCEINGATINNIKSRLVDCETIFTQSGFAHSIYAYNVLCSNAVSVGSFAAKWQTATINGTTIYYLGRKNADG